MSTLYIFIDESGDLQFSPKNSKNFYMGALVTHTISAELIHEMYKIRHKHLISDDIYKSRQDKDLEYFHATEDLQTVRDDIFQMISTSSEEVLRFYSVYTEKNKANPIFHTKPEVYYSKHIMWLMNSVLYRENIETYERIMIFFDGMPVSKNKKAMFKWIKKELSIFFETKQINLPYFIYSHQSKSHHYLQIADYMNWSINVANERDEKRPLITVSKYIRNIWNPFEKSTRIYF